VARENLGRLEFTIRADDLELLHRIARNRGCSASELVRRSLYEALEPLARAQKEREMKTAAEIEDRRKLAAWTGERRIVELELPERGDMPPLKYPS
jgi:hypothetical protein